MNFFRTVFALCINFQSYRDIRDASVGDAIRYLVKLVVLLAFVLTLSFIPVALQGTDTLAKLFDKGRPEFSIKGGRVVTDVKEAKYWGNEELRFGLVPEGREVEPPPKAVYGLVFAGDHFSLWMTATNAAPGTIRPVENKLKGLPDGEVTGEYFRRLIRVTLPVMLPIGWIVLALVGTLMCLLQAYTFAVIGSLMERNLPGGLTFNQLLNVTMHAVTPAAILVTVYTALQLPGLDMWLVYLIAFGIFLLGATNACRDRTARDSTEEDEL